MTPERERVAIEAMQSSLAPMIDLLVSKLALITTRELGGSMSVEESYALDYIIVNAIIDRLKRDWGLSDRRLKHQLSTKPGLAR